MAILKFLHILGVVLMVGNVITTGLWAHLAVKGKDGGLNQFAANSILKADLFLTVTGGGLILIPGFVMMNMLKLPLLQTPWILYGTISLAISTLIWLIFLLPYQFKMEKYASQNDLAAFKTAYTRWSILGWIDTIPLIYGIWVMVVK